MSIHRSLLLNNSLAGWLALRKVRGMTADVFILGLACWTVVLESELNAKGWVYRTCLRKVKTEHSKSPAIRLLGISHREENSPSSLGRKLMNIRVAFVFCRTLILLLRTYEHSLIQSSAYVCLLNFQYWIKGASLFVY